MNTTPHPRNEWTDLRADWLRREIRRIAPHLGDQPSDRGYIHALETLAHELHTALADSMLKRHEPTPTPATASPVLAPRMILWDPTAPDAPAQWRNAGRASTAHSVAYIRFDIFADLCQPASLVRPSSEASPC
jgi:hypothetical protein